MWMLSTAGDWLAFTELTRVVVELGESEDVLSEFKTDGNLTSIDDESRELHERVTQAQSLYNQVKNQMGAKLERLRLLNEKIAAHKKDIRTTAIEPTVAGGATVRLSAR